MNFPSHRPRRMRRTQGLRNLTRETHFSLSQLVAPYFVKQDIEGKEAIRSMPGQFRWSPDGLQAELEEIQDLGLGSILLFGLPTDKDESGRASHDAKRGIVQETLRLIKKNFPDLVVMTDVCLCAYTSHGHCGIANPKGEIDNDASVQALQKIALSHAEAGADIVAPSDMMDGRVRAIREILDQNKFESTGILSYAAKYASAFYGPFREAADSAPSFGDRKSYQMDPANREEAMREIELDIHEGADMVMVKPALAYLDVIAEAKRRFAFPLAGYSVSGEYAMIKTASEAGFLDEKKAAIETLTAIRRAGAQVILTYYAKQISLWTKEDKEIGKIFSSSH